MGSPEHSRLLALPQELRDHVYSFCLAPAIRKQEHPFPDCLPGHRRGFVTYCNLCLVSRCCYQDVRSYFIKHIASKITFYFTHVDSLRIRQARLLNHALLKDADFQIRCGSGARSLHQQSLTAYRISAEREKVEALIRIQPGYEPWMDDTPGFYQTHAMQPIDDTPLIDKGGVFVLPYIGGAPCESRNCQLKSQNWPRTISEVHYPPLRQGRGAKDQSRHGVGNGDLQLNCYVWEKRRPGTSHLMRHAIMVLEGKLRDVWVPDNPVEVYLKQRTRSLRPGGT